MPTDSTTSSTSKLLLGCSQCRATLPDEAQFCLQCGKPVAIVSKPKSAPVRTDPRPVVLSKPPRRGRALLWILLALLVGVALWALASDSSGAQQLQGFIGLKQDRIILDSAFTVGPHTFRYYKFALPEGSMNVAVVGQFTSVADDPGSTRRNNKNNDKPVTSRTAL